MTNQYDDCWMPNCDRAIDRSLRVGLPQLCATHGFEIATHYREQILTTERLRLAKLEKGRRERDLKAQGNEGGRPLVYYARIGNYIKIGFSTRLQDRLRTLRADELLAIEPGGPEVERERHQQFKADRIDLRRENFRGSDELLRHVLATREKYGLPMWATRPRTTVVTTRKATP